MGARAVRTEVCGTSAGKSVTSIWGSWGASSEEGTFARSCDFLCLEKKLRKGTPALENRIFNGLSYGSIQVSISVEVQGKYWGFQNTQYHMYSDINDFHWLRPINVV